MSGFGSKTGPLALFVAFMLPVGALASCGGAGAPANDGGEEQAGQAEEAAAPSTERDDGASSETTVAAAGVERTRTGDGGEVAVMRDGVWEVGDAGEIEFRFEDGALSLIGTRANSGWEVEIDEQEADEIEVDFGRENIEWDFDVEAEGNVLRVEMTQQVDDAEALAHGLPVVACSVGPIPELVGEEAALLVEPGDVEALSGALDLLLSDAALRGRMSAAARRRAGDLPRWEDTVIGFLGVLQEVVAQRSS